MYFLEKHNTSEGISPNDSNKNIKNFAKRLKNKIKVNNTFAKKNEILQNLFLVQ